MASEGDNFSELVAFVPSVGNLLSNIFKDFKGFSAVIDITINNSHDGMTMAIHRSDALAAKCIEKQQTTTTTNIHE